MSRYWSLGCTKHCLRDEVWGFPLSPSQLLPVLFILSILKTSTRKGILQGANRILRSVPRPAFHVCYGANPAAPQRWSLLPQPAESSSPAPISLSFHLPSPPFQVPLRILTVTSLPACNAAPEGRACFLCGQRLPMTETSGPTSVVLSGPQCQPATARRREVFCWSHSFSFEGSLTLKTNRTGFPTTCFWDPLGNLGGAGRNQVPGLSQGILVTQIMFQD